MSIARAGLDGIDSLLTLFVEIHVTPPRGAKRLGDSSMAVPG